jgi:lysylphosphatidylglycerol synthetase-like protein (DUF2156 family)
MTIFPLFPLLLRVSHNVRACAYGYYSSGNSGNSGNTYIYPLLLTVLMTFPLGSCEWEQVGMRATVGQLSNANALTVQDLRRSPLSHWGYLGMGQLGQTDLRCEFTVETDLVKMRWQAALALFWCAANRHICLTGSCSKAVQSSDTARYLLDLQRSHKSSVYRLLHGSFPQPPAQAAALGNSVKFLWVKVSKCGVLTDCLYLGYVVLTGVARG